MNQATVTTETGRSQLCQIEFLRGQNESGIIDFNGQQWQLSLKEDRSSLKLIKLSGDEITLDLGFDIIYSMGQLQQKCIIDFGLGVCQAQLFDVRGGVEGCLSVKLLMKSLSEDKVDNLSSAIGQMKVQSSLSGKQSVPEFNTTITQDMPEFKLLLVGGAETTADFMSNFQLSCEQRYVSSLGVEVRPLVFHTNRGPIKFNVWTHTDQENGLRDGYYVQGAILMFDVTSRITYTNVPYWHRDLTRVCENIPIVVAGHNASKDSVPNVKASQITFHNRKKNMQYYETATTGACNEKPFLWLARKLSGDDQLHFVEAPALQPPEFQFDEATKQKYEQELAAAAAIPLPEDDDDDDL